MKLNYKVKGEGKPLVIIHGLFGSLDNWQTLANRFSENYKVFLVDLRNHGKSPHTEEHTYELMANDLREFFIEHKLEDVFLLGHSMGGKTAMLFSHLHPEFLQKLIVVDIGVKGYPPHHTDILNGLNAIPQGELASRSKADEILIKHVQDISTRQFLLKNLTRDDHKKLKWKMNLPVLEKYMEKIGSELPIDPVYLQTLFIRGEQSNYILESDYDSLEHYFPYSEIVTAEGAGHWVHAQAPDFFYETVNDFLDA